MNRYLTRSLGSKSTQGHSDKVDRILTQQGPAEPRNSYHPFKNYGGPQSSEYLKRPHVPDGSSIDPAGAYALNRSQNGDQGGGISSNVSDGVHRENESSDCRENNLGNSDQRQSKGCNRNAGADAPPSRSKEGGARLKSGEHCDAQIKDEVYKRLCNSREVDVHDVSVEVTAGQVCLEGTVPGLYMRNRIENIIDEIHCVTDVIDRLRIRWHGRRENPTDTKGKVGDQGEALARANATEGAEDGGGAGSSGPMAESS